MGLLLYLVGLLALASGTARVLRAKRRGRGQSPFALAEILTGAAVVLASGLGLARWSGAPVVVIVAVAVIVASLIDGARRTLRDRDRAMASEADRLERYMKMGGE